jgi:hypothetical protein
MKNRKRTAQGLTVLGSVVLFLSAAFHGFGAFPPISAALHASGIDPMIARALQAVWLMASSHWTVVGIIALVACFARSGPRRLILLLCGLVPLIDAVGGYAAIGLFIGDELLVVAAVAILSAAALLPSTEI